MTCARCGKDICGKPRLMKGRKNYCLDCALADLEYREALLEAERIIKEGK